jgi:hypothetical protein
LGIRISLFLLDYINRGAYIINTKNYVVKRFYQKKFEILCFFTQAREVFFNIFLNTGHTKRKIRLISPIEPRKSRKNLFNRLRARLDDIPALVHHFIAKFNGVFQQTVKGIDKEALDVLTRYQWPGNVRELESAIENAFAFGNSEIIHKLNLSVYITERLEMAGEHVFAIAGYIRDADNSGRSKLSGVSAPNFSSVSLILCGANGSS